MLRKVILPLVVLTSLSLSGCLVRAHRWDIQQGNVLPAEKVAQLHNGMTRQQVVNLLGAPVLDNTLNGNKLIYVYTWQPGYGKLQQQHVILYFRNGRLVSFDTNVDASHLIPQPQSGLH